MKILVINGDCVQTNSSANLCHLAYINGLVASGHEVSLLSADGRDYKLDPNMSIPDEVKQYTYYGVSLYEKLSMKKSTSGQVYAGSLPTSGGSKTASPGFKRRLVRKIKNIVLSMYGVHGIYAKFVRVARRFRSDEEYDYVLSVSTPVTSHLLAHDLLAAKHIKAKHWIQIWEDPWYSDAYGFNGDRRIYDEEKRLLSFAEKICYVSPLTLKKQQSLYPESADKMYWQPLPFYYKAEATDIKANDGNSYGYFGNYYSQPRNLEPFYKAAASCGITVNICGGSDIVLPETESIHVFPRLTLDKLTPIEASTNVLVFLCNRRGGQIPGKIYQYSATNKTILFILDGTDEEKQVIREYFERYNRYVFCENTAEDIARAINCIQSGNTGGVSNEPINDFDPKLTIQRILEG